MRVETWLPLVTLALGWAGAQITEILRDRRTSDRERQARQGELQRATLLDLQDALLELSNRTSEVQHMPETLWKRMSVAAQAEMSRRQHQARVRSWDTQARGPTA
jgi:hypothetical protein